MVIRRSFGDLSERKLRERLRGNPDFSRSKGSWEVREWRLQEGAWALGCERKRQKKVVEGGLSGGLLFVILVTLR